MARTKGSKNKKVKADIERTESRSVSLTLGEWEFLQYRFPTISPTLAAARIIRKYIDRIRDYDL